MLGTGTTTFTYTHPSLGNTLCGVLLEINGQQLVQFRGLKYGHIKERFASAELVEGFRLPGIGIVDCTAHGPQCPQVPTNEEAILGIPKEFNPLPTIKSDELNCLNLVVTVPKAALEGLYTSQLPVYFHIHGGGWKVGSVANGYLDLSHIVARGIATSKPFIGIGINYRLDYFGFAAIPGVTDGNLALFDQRLALQWVSRHVSGFGGNPKKVTLSGQSAGAVSTDAHLNAYQSNEKEDLQLFKRACIMSGTFWTLPALSLEQQRADTKEFGQVLESYLQEKGRGVENYIEAYKVATVEEILIVQDRRGSVGFPSPTFDGKFFHDSKQDLKLYDKVSSWCEGLFIGDCQFEAHSWAQQVLAAPTNVIIDAFASFKHPKFPNGLGDALVEAYNITPENPQQGALDFVGDALFNYHCYRTANAWRSHPEKRVYQYAFDQLNPFDPKFGGAHHIIDIIYVNGIFAKHYPLESQRKLGTDFQDMLIEFITAEELSAGGQLWGNNQVTILGPNGVIQKVELEGKEHRESRRIEAYKILQKFKDEDIVRALVEIVNVTRSTAIANGVEPARGAHL